jgi:hypothetical protein
MLFINVDFSLLPPGTDEWFRRLIPELQRFDRALNVILGLDVLVEARNGHGGVQIRAQSYPQQPRKWKVEDFPAGRMVRSGRTIEPSEPEVVEQSQVRRHWGFTRALRGDEIIADHPGLLYSWLMGDLVKFVERES